MRHAKADPFKSLNGTNSYTIIGRALENKDSDEAGTIEIVVGAK